MSVKHRPPVCGDLMNCPTTGRNRMRDLRPPLLALLLGAALVGCRDDTAPTTTAPDAASSTAEPVETSEVIPDGSYAKTATLAVAHAMGITDQAFLRALGDDGETSYVFKFAGDRWTVFVVEDVAEPGDYGTLEYDEEGLVSMTSESDGCPGCVGTYDWSLAGDELSLSIVGHESTDTPAEALTARFVTEGTFTRQP